MGRGFFCCLNAHAGLQWSYTNLAPLVREMGGETMVELIGYDNFARDIKQLIHDKQYRALQMLNTETVALYWAIGREIYRQQQEKGWENLLWKCSHGICSTSFQGRRDIRLRICGACAISISPIMSRKISHHWCEK